MRRGLTCLVRVLLAATICASLAFGQTATKEWRARNDFGDRYEGTDVTIEVANPRIELVSFLAAPIPSDLKATTLHLFFYPTRSAPVHIWAREREVKEQYWMEPKTPAGGWKPNQWNALCTWRTNVLDKIALAPDNLGIVARLDNKHPGSGMVAPVIVTTAKQPVPSKIAEYEASFRLGIRRARVSYTVMTGCTAGESVSSGAAGVRNGGEIFSIRFKAPEGPGEASLVVTATPLDKTPPDERRFCFVPPPAVPPPCPTK